MNRKSFSTMVFPKRISFWRLDLMKFLVSQVRCMERNIEWCFSYDELIANAKGDENLDDEAIDRIEFVDDIGEAKDIQLKFGI